MLTDAAHWMRLEPLVEACRAQGQDRTKGSTSHNLGDRMAWHQNGAQVARHSG